MWFNQFLLFNFSSEKQENLTEILEDSALKPCPPHARFLYGWLPVTTDCYARELAGTTLICMGKEERILPRSVILRELEERVANKEAELQSRLTRSERSQMAEEIEFELLPKAFCLQKRTLAILDTMENRLMINTSSQTQAMQFTALLRKSVPNLHLEPLKFPENLPYRFAEWINNPSSLPPAFDLASDCMLFSPDNEKKRVNCKGYELPADEVLSLLKQGLLPSEVSLQWNERIQFTLTHEFTIKRIKCLDYLVEEFNNVHHLEDEAQQFDASLMILTHELRSLVNALLDGLSNTKPISNPKQDEIRTN